MDTASTLPMGSGTESSKRRARRKSMEFWIDYGLPLGIGLVASLFIYIFLGILSETPLFGAVHAKLAERGVLPYICVILLCWHLSHILVRYFVHIRHEKAVFAMDPIPASDAELSDKDLESLAGRAQEMEAAGGSLVSKRILLAVLHLSIRRDTAELAELLKQRSEGDRQRAASAYALPNFIFWAIPILGFVGTVLGIGIAVSQLKTSLSDMSEMAALVTELGKVADGLGVAFDTTLVALIMSVIALLAQTIIQQTEVHLLADVDDYMTYRLQSRIRTETEDVRNEKVMQAAIGRLINATETMQK
jgi:biopolymer transport protein ExbB/TolQ